MTVIITGVTGFLGRNIAESLVKEGMVVIGTGRSQLVGGNLKALGVDFRPADIRASNFIQALSPADCLIHCAGKTGDWGDYRDFYQVNVEGTRNVINAAKKHGIGRIIFISTPSIYYNGKDRLSISESDPLPAKQRSAYAKTKLMAESELMALKDDDFQVMIFRPRAVFGPYDSTFVPRILTMGRKKRFPLINGGRALVDITCVENLVDAVQRAMIAPDRAWNEVYNLTNGEPVTIKDWFSRMLSFFGQDMVARNLPVPMAKVAALLMESAGRLPFGPKRPMMTRFSVGYMSRSMTMSIDKVKHFLGYIPKVSNEEGFRRCAEWYRAHEMQIVK